MWKFLSQGILMWNMKVLSVVVHKLWPRWLKFLSMDDNVVDNTRAMTCVNLVTRPSTWYHNFYLATLTLKFDLLSKTLTLVITDNHERQSFHIAHVYSLWQDLLHSTISFELVILTLKFDLLLKNFNLGCYLVMIATWCMSLSFDNFYYILVSIFQIIGTMKLKLLI